MEKCKHEGHSGDVWSRHKVKCRYKASTPAGYCKVHDPELAKAKRDKQTAEWKQKWDDDKHQGLIKAKEREALEVVKRIATGVENPIETARDFIRELDAVINNTKGMD